jgi:hypothetical protein
MEQVHGTTYPTHLPSIFTYIAVVLVVTFSQERWDSWDLLVGSLGICAFAATLRGLHKGDRIEHACNSLLLGLSVYVLACALCMLLGFLILPAPELEAGDSDLWLIGRPAEALLRRYLTVPRCALEDWWFVIVFVAAAIGFVFSTSFSNSEPAQSVQAPKAASSAADGQIGQTASNEDE